jgi:hypothetical protein
MLEFESAQPMRVTGMTFVEDANYPESWMRDAQVQYWDGRVEEWKDGPYLLANAAQHTHRFEKPIESTKLRLVNKAGLGWPVGNLRFGEIVFHGSN